MLLAAEVNRARARSWNCGRWDRMAASRCRFDPGHRVASSREVAELFDEVGAEEARDEVGVASEELKPSGMAWVRVPALTATSAASFSPLRSIALSAYRARARATSLNLELGQAGWEGCVG